MCVAPTLDNLRACVRIRSSILLSITAKLNTVSLITPILSLPESRIADIDQSSSFAGVRQWGDATACRAFLRIMFLLHDARQPLKAPDSWNRYYEIDYTNADCHFCRSTKTAAVIVFVCPSITCVSGPKNEGIIYYPLWLIPISLKSSPETALSLSKRNQWRMILRDFL